MTQIKQYRDDIAVALNNGESSDVAKRKILKDIKDIEKHQLS